MSDRQRFRLRALGLVGFFAFTFAVFLVLLHSSGVRSPTSDYREIQVVLPNAANLAKKADVRIGGVKVGQVTDVRVVRDTAIAELQLEDKAGPVYANARPQLRYKSALNEGYIDLVRGGGPRARELRDGGVVPLSQAEQTVQVDEVLSTFDARTRKRLQGALDGLGRGLDGQGQDLNDTFASTSTLVDRGTPLLETLAGDRRRTGQLVDDFGQVAAALGARETALRVLARRSRVIAEAVQSRDGQVREVFKQLPSALQQARRSSQRLAVLAQTATPVLGDMRVALTRLAPAIRRLLPAAQRARSTVAQLRRFIPRAEPLLARLGPFASATNGLLPPLDAVMREMIPLSTYFSSQKENVTAFFANYTAATKSSDVSGHLNSLSFLFNKEALTADLPSEGLKALEALEDAGVLSAIGGNVQQNAYPAEGTLAHPNQFSGRYPRLLPLPPKLEKSP